MVFAKLAELNFVQYNLYWLHHNAKNILIQDRWVMTENEKKKRVRYRVWSVRVTDGDFQNFQLWMPVKK